MKIQLRVLLDDLTPTAMEYTIGKFSIDKSKLILQELFKYLTEELCGL